MTSNGADRVLAIGLDAAESTMIRRMIGAGDLPVMRSLLDRGSWTRVTSPARLSSGAVWPSFYTGQHACDHGQYGRWVWDPDAMNMAYTDASRQIPFWQVLADAGTTVGIIDVPFAPFVGLSSGFEVSEWGPHDRIVGRVRVAPAPVAKQVTTSFPAHPFSDDLAEPPASTAEAPAFLDQCIAGVRLRGDLAEHLIAQAQPDLTVVVFTEAHHGGHFLWHTVQPDDDLYADIPAAPVGSRTLADMYRELDRQVGRLVDTAGPATTVLVFAIHGMEPTRGVPSVLEPALIELGMAHVDESADRRRSVLTRLKGRIPEPLRSVYRRSVPLSRRSELGRSAIIPSYDWSRTRAFALPLDHEGHIRVNLAGREAQGIVPAEQYSETCDTIEAAVRTLTTTDGRPIVQDVIRPPRGAHSGGLPDLVVHWHRAALESPARIGDVEVHPILRELTGMHSPDGFLIATGRATGLGGESIAAEDLHRLIGKVLPR
jgi:predicted AlkP superfamily phosphohydrolase/phosphomutase